MLAVDDTTVAALVAAAAALFVALWWHLASRVAAAEERAANAEATAVRAEATARLALRGVEAPARVRTEAASRPKAEALLAGVEWVDKSGGRGGAAAVIACPARSSDQPGETIVLVVAKGATLKPAAADASIEKAYPLPTGLVLATGAEVQAQPQPLVQRWTKHVFQHADHTRTLSTLRTHQITACDSRTTSTWWQRHNI